MRRAAAIWLTPVLAALAQDGAPRFGDFPAPADWKGPAAALKLETSDERQFRSHLVQAAKEPPNFAAHYRFTMWGCGSECASGAVIDLVTGKVMPPPLGTGGNPWDRFIVCASSFEGSGVEVRVDSRLVILRCGLNYDERLKRNVPDVYYFVLEGNRFRRLARFRGGASLPSR